MLMVCSTWQTSSQFLTFQFECLKRLIIKHKWYLQLNVCLFKLQLLKSTDNSLPLSPVSGPRSASSSFSPLSQTSPPMRPLVTSTRRKWWLIPPQSGSIQEHTSCMGTIIIMQLRYHRARSTCGRWKQREDYRKRVVGSPTSGRRSRVTRLSVSKHPGSFSAPMEKVTNTT